MPTVWTLTLIAGGVIAFLLVIGAHVGRTRRPKRGVLFGVAYAIFRVYVGIIHMVRYEYEEGALEDAGDGPLIIVCNHTAGVDPLLVTLGLPWHIRWLMAREVMLPWLGWFWDIAGVISIAREGSGHGGLRRAFAHLDQGGVIGIFPEGRIERPQGVLMPFATGVGMLVKRSRARVLPVVIEDTPYTHSAWESVWTPCRARVRVMKPIDYAAMGTPSAEIPRDLERRFAEWTGWPRVERPEDDDLEIDGSVRDNAPSFGYGRLLSATRERTRQIA